MKIEDRNGTGCHGDRSFVPSRGWHQHMLGGVVCFAGCGTFLRRCVRPFEDQINDQICRAAEAKYQRNPCDTEGSRIAQTAHGWSIEGDQYLVNPGSIHFSDNVYKSANLVRQGLSRWQHRSLDRFPRPLKAASQPGRRPRTPLGSIFRRLSKIPGEAPHNKSRIPRHEVRIREAGCFVAQA